jgi:hypothetical protein
MKSLRDSAKVCCRRAVHKNIDQFGEGTAKLMSEGIAYYCANKK